MADGSGQLPAGIRTPDQRLRVFVSSTLEELAAERSAAREAIEQLRLAPVMFESGARPHPAQDVYRAYLEQSDVFVGIYWQQYGWIGPNMHISGLEDEFRLSAGLPRLLYVKEPAPDQEPGLRQMLDRVRSEGGSAYKTFEDAEELRELLLTDLVTVLTERFEGAQENQAAVVPTSITPLIGRDYDIQEITKLLESGDRRLIVLTGAGGIGKTRLAVAVMEHTTAHWADGVAFVDLSSVTDIAAVPDAVAAALGMVSQGRERALDMLERRLADRHMLLVLDNFEQIIDAASIVAELVRRTQRLHLLVTSRVVLRVRGEQEWRVEPLSLQPGEGVAEKLADAPAVQLFVARVRDVRPDFMLTDENAVAVAELCRRLDGLPLALELAAAWMRLLTPEQMLQRLYERLERPGALADLPSRQQTLTATIEWSYDLLPPAARRVLTRLSVFAAPFTADAVETVCGSEGVDATEALSTLLDHSMVSPASRPDGQPGFRLLDAIRRFAAERLEDGQETLGRMEAYLLDILAAAGVRHGSGPWALRTLDSELLNLRAVLAWTVETRRPAGRLLRQLGDGWVWLLVRGHLRHAAELGQQVESISPSQLSTDSDRNAWQWLLSSGLLADGHFAEVGELLDPTLADVRRLEEPWRVSVTLLRRAISRPYAQDSPARAELEEGLAVARGGDDQLILGYILSHFGAHLAVDGDVSQARKLHTEMLTISQSLSDDNQRAEAHYDLAMDALAADDPGEALPHLAVAARHYRDFDHRDGLTRCIGSLSWLARERGDSMLAARLIGAAAGNRDNIGLAPWPMVTEAEGRVAGQVEASLSSNEFAAQVSVGRAQQIDEALAQAFEALGGDTAPASW
jgi:predicted ATPase